MNDTPETRAEFALAIGGLWIAFNPGKPAEPETIAAYWIGLHDLDLADIKHAATRAMRELKFFPRIAEIRELAGVANLPAAARAVLAWQSFVQNRLCLRSRSKIAFDDPVITAVVRNLGIERCVSAQGDDRDVWLRKDFIEAYSWLAPTVTGPVDPLPGLERGSNLYIGGKPAPLPAEVEAIATGLPWVQAIPRIEAAS